MLILDKQRAVERVVALTAAVMETPVDAQPAHAHARTYQRIATYERRAHVAPASLRRGGERRRRRMRLLAAPAPA